MQTTGQPNRGMNVQRTLLHVAAMIGLLLMLTGTSSAYYDPVGGRFLSPDPLGHEMSMDLYSYANGDPVNFCDPDGRCGQNSMQAMSDPLTQAYVQGLKQSNIGQTHMGSDGGSGLSPREEFIRQTEQQLDYWAYLDNTIDPSERDNPLRHDPIARFSANVLRGASDALVLPALFAYPFESTSRREWSTGRSITEQEAMFHLLGVAATLPLMIIAPEARVEAGLLEGAGTRMVGAEARALGAKVEADNAKFLAQGFSEAQAEYLAQPYEGMGHHFLRRNWGLPQTITDSSFSILKPSGISRGDFYELHYKVDPTFYGAAFPRSVGGSWNGTAIGLEKYGFLGQMWYGSPTPLKIMVGGAAGAGGIGAYWYLNNSR